MEASDKDSQLTSNKCTAGYDDPGPSPRSCIVLVSPQVFSSKSILALGKTSGSAAALGKK